MQQIGFDNRVAPVGTLNALCLNLNTRKARSNAFNACLARERRYWQTIRDCGGLEKICCPNKYLVEPWLKMPALGRRYSRINSITVPTDDGLDHLVTSFNVPTGYDGIIQQMVNFYTGGGFNEGSGQLHWRVRFGSGRYVQDYGDIQVTMGSLATPYTVFQGPVRISSRQTINYFISNTPASGLAGGTIVCGFFGWFYPR